MIDWTIIVGRAIIVDLTVDDVAAVSLVVVVLAIVIDLFRVVVMKVDLRGWERHLQNRERLDGDFFTN